MDTKKDTPINATVENSDDEWGDDDHAIGEQYLKQELERIKGQRKQRWVGSFTMFAGFFMATAGLLNSTNNLEAFRDFFLNNLFLILGAIFAGFGAVFYLGGLNRIADVDFLRRASRRRARLAPQAAWPFPTQVKEKHQNDFKSTIKGMTELLRQQAETYDVKASKLLDKGVVYAGVGLLFFFISIVAWQLIFHFFGFSTAHIYGIASCASLFVAIEVISAWFLRQYRNFIDSSTELLKIKAIFDKIILLKLASDESLSSESLEAQLGEALARDFTWPERPVVPNKGGVDVKNLNEILSLAQKLLKDSKSSS
ncbi:hypothetical protein ACF8PL_26980 [Delftia sp. WSY_4]|uniref:hypothetical protein n=1 Tax=unclassified Delftia TaxID=2613839 RepID=UPI00370BD699